jgi:cell division septum initiation protein DivIVA
MSDFDRTASPVEDGAKRRSASSRFADLGDRLARTFSGQQHGQTLSGYRERPALEPRHWDPDPVDEVDYDAAETAAWPTLPERFPVVHHGYDPIAVDEEIAQLERELGELRARRIESVSVEEEIDKIGEQTASILRTAYEQAHDITHSARVQADKCVADAAANAVSITEDANRRLREIDAETENVWNERARLIEDARTVAGQMMSLADSALERFREETSKTTSTELPRPVVPRVSELGSSQPEASPPEASQPEASPHEASPPGASHPGAFQPVAEPFDHEQPEV